MISPTQSDDHGGFGGVGRDVATMDDRAGALRLLGGVGFAGMLVAIVASADSGTAAPVGADVLDD